MREEQDVRGRFLAVLRGATPAGSTFIDRKEVAYRHSCEGSLTSGTETQAQPAQETLSTGQAQAIEEIVQQL